MTSLSAADTDSLWLMTQINTACMTTNPSQSHQSAIAQSLLGFNDFQRGAYAEAMVHFEQALSRLESAASLPVVEALILGYMGQIYSLRGQHWFALACYDAALDTCKREDNSSARYCQMKLYGWVAELCQCCGHDDLANHYCNEALALRHQLNQGVPA
jgi:tetratricopeptide (TPR) repeat protein